VFIRKNPRSFYKLPGLIFAAKDLQAAGLEDEEGFVAGYQFHGFEGAFREDGFQVAHACFGVDPYHRAPSFRLDDFSRDLVACRDVETVRGQGDGFRSNGDDHRLSRASLVR